MAQSPPSLLGAAGVQAAETAVILTATVLVGIDTAAGRSYRASSGIALTIIGVVTVVLLGLVAVGLARARRWSRTPALLTQLFVGVVGVYLVEGSRYDWGVTSIVLAVAGLAALLLPASVRALAEERQPPGAQPPAS